MNDTLIEKFSEQYYQQIKAVLGGASGVLALTKRYDSAPLEDRHFGDFIQIKPSNVLDYVLTSGFNSQVVAHVPEAHDAGYDDRINVHKEADGWHVYYLERGERVDETVHATYEEATKAVIDRLFETAIVHLSAKFRDKHFPELAPIPKLGQPWPDGQIRY